MAEVVDCTTSRTAWLALEASFSHSSTSRANQLCEELLSLRRGSTSVHEYGKRFKSICDQLSAIGLSVDETDKSHWFLRGLGIQFASFADTRMAMEHIPTFSTLLHQAIQFELMHKAMEGSPSQSQVAFATNTSSNSSLSHGHSTNSPSNNSGHKFSVSRGGLSAGRGGKGPRRPPRCQICRGEHYADRCPQFLNRQPASTADLAQAFHASCNIQTPAPIFSS